MEIFKVVNLAAVNFTFFKQNIDLIFCLVKLPR